MTDRQTESDRQTIRQRDRLIDRQTDKELKGSQKRYLIAIYLSRVKAINDEGESDPLEGDKPIIAKNAFGKDITNFFTGIFHIKKYYFVSKFSINGYKLNCHSFILTV